MTTTRHPFLSVLLGCALLAAASAAQAIEVSRAQFTTAVENREPVDTITTLAIDHARVYFFSEIRDGQDQTITHRWLYQGRVMAELAFAVKGPRWRVWSSKNLIPAWTGTWTVQVVDGNGVVLTEKRFEYVE